MTDVAANSTTTATVQDGVYLGQLEYVGDEDWIAVELTAGVTYDIKILGSDSDNGNAQYLGITDIYNSAGATVSHDQKEYYQLRQDDEYFTTEAHTVITPGASGTYYIAVNGWDIDQGSYTVFVSQDQLGGDENESISGTNGVDSLLGGRGDDTLSGGSDNDYLDGEWGDDVLTGGDGADTFRFYSDDWDDIRDGTADLWGNDTVTDFDPSEDTLHFAGRIVRDLDDFTITESGGNTTLTTDWGDSVTLLNVSADELADTDIRYRLGVRLVGTDQQATDGNDTLTGDAGENIIYGLEGNDVINGGDGHDYLRGFAGNDSINGGDDVDVIGGEDGDDTLAGGAGDDYIVSHDGNDVLRGDGGGDLLEAGNGNDSLNGGIGDDTLRPGMGDDTMTGGNGADIFVLGRGWGDDRITDFNINVDILDFQGSGLDAEDLTITASGNNTVISGDGNTLTLVGVDATSFEAAIDTLVLGAGSITSYYTDFGSVETENDPTDDILTTTNVIADGNAHWETDADGITRVSYSFVDGDYDIQPDADSTWWIDAGEPVTPYAQYLTELEIARVESYTNLDMVWVEDTGVSLGDIRFGYHQFVIGGASSTPYEGVGSGDVWIGIHIGDDSSAFFVHEMGHSLGLRDLAVWNEYTGQDYTIMSYVKSARYEDAEYSSVPTETYQWADLAALQYLYGVDTETTAGNDTFTYDLSEDMLQTIFDAGGTDTIEVTGTGDAVHIDLTPGSWSNIGPNIVYNYYENDQEFQISEPGTLLIMPNTIIENAKGSAGNDTLTGNSADNTLIGFDGADLVEAGAGDDTVWAGAGDNGNDTLRGNAGNDVLAGGNGGDLIVGGLGADMGFGGDGNDTLVGHDWSGGTATTSETSANQLWAGDGDDQIWGAAGNDQLGGGLGDDTIMGGAGADRIYAGKEGEELIEAGDGDDLAFGSTENDIVRGNGGADELYGGSGDDTVSGDAGADTLYGGTGADKITGGTGDDLLYPGAGADTLVFASGHGNDTVSGFDLSEDSLDLRNTDTDFQSVAAVESASTEETIDGAAGVLIDTGSGNSIFLAGISLNDIADIQAVF